jgi:hypothetical protein
MFVGVRKENYTLKQNEISGCVQQGTEQRNQLTIHLLISAFRCVASMFRRLAHRPAMLLAGVFNKKNKIKRNETTANHNEN